MPILVSSLSLSLSDIKFKTNIILETNIWTKDEIKSFEELILKHDKNFSEISKSVSPL
jgi:hypothetical protein